MPKILRARPAADAAEERTVRRLAAARHAPADWIQRGRIITLSWSGLRVPAIAEEVGCHEQTVRRWLVRFNASGLDGLGDLGGQGRRRRITEAERSRIIALVNQVPPGRPVRSADGELEAAGQSGPLVWTLDTLTAAARAAGIDVHRSQVRFDPAARRSPLAPHPVLDPQQGPRLRPKRTRIVGLYTAPPEGSTVLCADELAPGDPAYFPTCPGLVHGRAPDQKRT